MTEKEKEFLNSKKDRARTAYQNYRDGAISRAHLFVHLEQGSLFDDTTELLMEELDSVRDQLRQKNIEFSRALETAQKSNPKIAILLTSDWDQKVMIGTLSDLFRKLLQEGILETDDLSVKEIEAYMVGEK